MQIRIVIHWVVTLGRRAARGLIRICYGDCGQWFHWAAEIARTCPGHRLWFPRDADPVALRELISI